MPASEPQLRIGRYALLGRVGHGGMGEVHRARAFGAAGVTKELCIKRIRQSRLSDPDALGRFVDEARLWMRLSHGNIVPVFDFGRMENDYYLAMEWVDGCDLRRLLDDAKARAEPLEDDVVLFIAAAIARALSYLHDASAHEGRAVAHCDLKPGNVLVSRSGEVKLADFGVAVATESSRAGGTRGYIPPSAARGDQVDASDDLYALGRVLGDLLERPGAPAAPSAEGDAARALAARLSSSDEPGSALTAARVTDELEALSAQARVRCGRSPRELLARRVGRVPEDVEPMEPTDVRTDASFVTQGADEPAFRRHMEARSERSTSSRRTPTPPVGSSRRGAREWFAVGVVAVVGLAAIALSQAGGPASVERAVGAPVGDPPRSPTASAPDPATDVSASHPVDSEVASESPVVSASRLAGPTRSRPVDARVPATATVPSSGAPRDAVRERPASPEPDSEREPREVAGHAEEPLPTRRVAEPERDVAGLAELAPAVAPPAERAHLRVNARPWADVTVDGLARGPTPITDLELEPGRHEVRLVHPVTGRESTTIVELGPGERRDVVVDLRR